MRAQLCEKFGIDLTAIEGVSIQTCLAFWIEDGTNVDKFVSAEHCACWMGFCPDNRITGGRTHAAHKIAHILWAMIKHRCPYDSSRLGNPDQARTRKERYLCRQASSLASP